MGLHSIVNRSLEFIPTIDYTTDRTDSLCSLFETNVVDIYPFLRISIADPRFRSAISQAYFPLMTC